MAVVESYKPSGKVAWGKVPVGLVIGGLVGIIAVVLYAVLTRWNLLGYIPLSIAGIHFGEVGMIVYWIGTVVGLWVAMAIVISQAKCRNPMVGLGLGLGLGLFFLYIHWMAVGLLLSSVFILPHDVFGMLAAMVEAGWMNFSLLETPGLNWIFWGIEAAGIVGMSAFAGFVSSKDPYCESCNTWADDEEKFDAPLSLGPESLAELMSAAQFHDLSSYGPAADPNAEFYRYRFTIKKCPSCDRLNVMDVESVTLEYDDDGDVEEKTDDVVSGLVLSLDALTELRATLTNGPAEPHVGEDESESEVPLA